MISLVVAWIAFQGKAPAQVQPPKPESPFPSPSVVPPPPEFLNWKGFGYLPEGARTVPQTFPAAGDWSSIVDQIGKLDDTHAPVWRMKIVAFHRMDTVVKLPGGVLWEEKNVLERPDIERVNRSIAQFQALVKAETDGKVKLQIDKVIEDETQYLGSRQTDSAIADYLYPRINGGAYQGEDSTYRGPYAAVLCIHPVCTAAEGGFEVNHTPVGTISAYGIDGHDVDGRLAMRLNDIWVRLVANRAETTGLRGPVVNVPPYFPDTALANPLAYVPDGDWGSLATATELSADVLEARLKMPVVQVATAPPPESKLLQKRFMGAESDVKIEPDPQHGQVLCYMEQGGARNGGLALPVGPDGSAHIDTSKTPTLTFWAKTDSPDPLAFRFAGDGTKTAMVCLGRDIPGPVALPQVEFQRDGLWHALKVDLKQTGLTTIDRIELVPTKNSQDRAKITYGLLRFYFADFKLTSDAPGPLLADFTPDPDSTDAIARAAWAVSATPGPKLLPLLSDRAWFVRLNALQQYVAMPDATALPALTESATSVPDGPVTVAALDALWKLDTEASKKIVQQVARTGVNEEGKAEAARLLAQTKDPQLAEVLWGLTQSRSIYTRIATVRALAELPGETSAMIRGATLSQEDPELKLAITQTFDPDSPKAIEKLRWSAVNEPSDAVRLASYIKLLESKDKAVIADGYKGVRDDSIEVRVQLLAYLAAHPSEANRPALRLAITDRSHRVRAAAITAFTGLDPISATDDIGPAINDRNPDVQLALLDLNGKGGFKLTDEVIGRMKTSPDPKVQAAANRH